MPRNEKHYFICQRCGIEFYNPKSAWRKPKFCGNECFGKSQRGERSKRINKFCEYCNQKFEVIPSKRKQRFCSKQCRGKNSTEKTHSTFTCDFCNKEFEVWTYRQPRFCSRLCMSKFAARQPKSREKTGKVKLICKICDKSYITTRFFAEHRNSKFCSRTCKGKNKAIEMVGEGNPNWIDGASPRDYGPNWGAQSRRARSRDNYTCQVCGYQSHIKNLDVHHIKPLRLFGDDFEAANHLSNLICLCRKCHRCVEVGKIPCPIPKPA